MSKLNPNDALFIRKMYQYNRKFREYVNEFVRCGKYTKDEVLNLSIAREVCMYYFFGDQTEEPAEPAPMC